MTTKIEKLFSQSNHLEAHPCETTDNGLVWFIYRSDDHDHAYGVYCKNLYTPSNTYSYTPWEVSELADLLMKIQAKLHLDQLQNKVNRKT